MDSEIITQLGIAGALLVIIAKDLILNRRNGNGLLLAELKDISTSLKEMVKKLDEQKDLLKDNFREIKYDAKDIQKQLEKVKDLAEA